MARVTISINADLWLSFRRACLERHMPASKMITALMTDQLTTWREQDTREARRHPQISTPRKKR